MYIRSAGKVTWPVFNHTHKLLIVMCFQWLYFSRNPLSLSFFLNNNNNNNKRSFLIILQGFLITVKSRPCLIAGSQTDVFASSVHSAHWRWVTLVVKCSFFSLQCFQNWTVLPPRWRWKLESFFFFFCSMMTRPQVRRKNVKTRCRNSGRSCFVNDSVSARISSEFLCQRFNAFFFFFL